MKRERSVWQSLVVVAVVIGSSYASNAAAQTGGQACVVSTQTITYTCRSSCTQSGCACNSTTSVMEPAGQYGNGVYYGTQTTSCCGATVSYIANPDGQCQVQGGAPVAADDNRLIFIRQCDGRFDLYALGE